jgi:trimeric autotransporter adhesin
MRALFLAFLFTFDRVCCKVCSWEWIDMCNWLTFALGAGENMKLMNWVLASACVATAATFSNAAFVLSEPFDAYTNGPLLGQGGWTITGTSVVNPFAVSGAADKEVAMLTTGQDAYRAFAAPVTKVDGSAIYTGVNINVSAAQATGDYFLHLSDPAGTTGNFYQRLFIRSSGTGYVVGMLGSSGGSAVYGTTVIPFNTDHRLAIAWNFVAGALNDTFSIYLDPTSTIEGSNTAYLSAAWTATGAEPAATIAAVNLRQGTASSAATLTVDDISVATDFASVVPEPTTLGLLAGLSVVGLRRRSAR